MKVGQKSQSEREKNEGQVQREAEVHSEREAKLESRNGAWTTPSNSLPTKREQEKAN